MRELKQLALEAACGNQAAADFLIGMYEAMHLWDDLIDKDKPIADAQINKVFTYLTCMLPTNPFYRQYSLQLSTAILIALQNWHVANEAERSATPGENGTVPLEVAFVLRSSYIDWITLAASLCGGDEHGRRTAVKVRELAHREGFQMYVKNLASERAAREGGLDVL